MDTFIHEEYVNKRHEMKQQQRRRQQQQLRVLTDLRSPATPQDAAAAPSTAGSPAMSATGGSRGAASFDRLLDYFKPN